jgi:lipid-A-disaccharide synthase
MAADGFDTPVAMDQIAVMGLTEILPRLPTILRRIRETGDALIRTEPDIVVTIDAPDFGLRVAARAREALAARDRRPLFVHYVAPSVWAWRPGRAKKMAARTDHLLALLPFEPPYFEKVGLSCDFVGHPAARLSEVVSPGDRSLRGELGVAENTPLVVALPGSRRGEIERLAPVFGEALGALARRRPGLVAVLPAAEHAVDLVTEHAARWSLPVTVLDPRGRPFAEAEARKLRAMAAADVALAASGTVSLELAAMRTPMVIGYRLAGLTATIARMLIKVDTATLVNLVSGTRAVPEFLQEWCEPLALAEALDALLGRNSAGRKAQFEAMEATMKALGEGDAPPGVRAARSVLSALERRRNSAEALSS